jgi:hypothetical protein
MLAPEKEGYLIENIESIAIDIKVMINEKLDAAPEIFLSISSVANSFPLKK